MNKAELEALPIRELEARLPEIEAERDAAVATVYTQIDALTNAVAAALDADQQIVTAAILLGHPGTSPTRKAIAYRLLDSLDCLRPFIPTDRHRPA